MPQSYRELATSKTDRENALTVSSDFYYYFINNLGWHVLYLVFEGAYISFKESFQ